MIAFSSLSALFNVLETRPLFVRERSNAYYKSVIFLNLSSIPTTYACAFSSPTAWLLVRFVFDVVPLRILPTMIVATM